MIFRSFLPFILIVLMLHGTLSAQQPDAYADVRCVSTVLLPGNEAVLSLMGDTLCVSSAGLLMRADYHNGEVLSLKADIEKNRLDKRVSYVVRHPVTDNLFYTTLNKRGRSSLYELVPREGKSPKSHRVKVGGLKYGVTHPVFSTDGRMMVFSARIPADSSQDIWYSFQTEKGWSRPAPMGGGVNAMGDETSPFFYGDYLFFSSRGRDASDPLVWRIYAVRLSLQPSEDSLMPPSMSVSQLQALPHVVNSGRGDMELVADTVHRTLHWVSYRNGNPMLFTATGTPEGFVLSGQVSDTYGRPMAGVRVEAWTDDRCLTSVTTDARGSYSLPLQVDRVYGIHFSHVGYFTQRVQIDEAHSHHDLLQPLRRDVTLNGLSLDVPLYIDNLFGDNADAVLTPESEQQLRQLAQFLSDNPKVLATISLHCSRTQDAYVNSRLNERRLAVLREYMSDHAPAVVARYSADEDDGRQDASDNRLSDWLEVTFQPKFK